MLGRVQVKIEEVEEDSDPDVDGKFGQTDAQRNAAAAVNGQKKSDKRCALVDMRCSVCAHQECTL
jgi:hypothetical protein